MKVDGVLFQRTIFNSLEILYYNLRLLILFT